LCVKQEKTAFRFFGRGLIYFAELKISLAALALAGFEPTLGLVDYIDPAFTAHDAAIAVAVLQRPEGVANFHEFYPLSRGAVTSAFVSFMRCCQRG